MDTTRWLAILAELDEQHAAKLAALLEEQCKGSASE